MSLCFEMFSTIENYFMHLDTNNFCRGLDPIAGATAKAGLEVFLSEHKHQNKSSRNGPVFSAGTKKSL